MYGILMPESSGTKGPLVPIGLSEDDILPTDLSPGSSSSTGSTGESRTSSSPSSYPKGLIPGSGQQLYQALNNGRPNPTPPDLSPIQRLQFALERTSLLSNVLNRVKGQQPSTDLPSPSAVPLRITKGPTEVKRGRKAAGSPKVMVDHEGGANGTQNGFDSPNEDPANIFQCPLCAVVCNGRHSFNEHLVTHTTVPSAACPKCDYVGINREILQDHMREVHGWKTCVEEEETSGKPNAQGKVKETKCKHCGHLSLTKWASYDHNANHIRSEKRLLCPMCPFVTEYKHHLEFHFRNHVGSKPYQCHVCSYSCVNKSMLNSHLKSHSAVYQYNCLDCDYQTKYCHSLKIHLRKLHHRPSMVLNPDGTPNPLPIIDVYGTRRGPKIKKSIPSTIVCPTVKGPPIKKPIPGYDSPPLPQQSLISSAKKIKVEPPDESPLPEESSPTPPLRRRHETSDSDSSEPNLGMRRLNGSHHPLSPPRFHPTRSSPVILDLAGNSKHTLGLYTVAWNQYLLSNPLLLTNPNSEQLTTLAKEQQRLMNELGNSHQARGYSPTQSPPLVPQSPLDLRNIKLEPEKRRRKGKALRYERQQPPPEWMDSDEGALDFSNNNNSHLRRLSGNVREGDVNYRVSHGSNNMKTCKYCEISFPDMELYDMHMRYHSGDSDPFLCRTCGKRTQDRIQFFHHLNTDSH